MRLTGVSNGRTYSSSIKRVAEFNDLHARQRAYHDRVFASAWRRGPDSSDTLRSIAFGPGAGIAVDFERAGRAPIALKGRRDRARLKNGGTPR